MTESLHKVWQLERDINRYKTLHLANVMDDQQVDLSELANAFPDDNRLRATWAPPRVVYYEDREREASHNLAGDFPHFWAAECPVFTRRALDALQDLIAPYGEFLPLSSAAGEFAAFKVLCFLDVLDVERSDIQWFKQLKREVGRPKHVEKIKRFAFLEQQLDGAVIFKVPQLPRFEVFVTSAFVDRVQEANLKGFLFRQVWPPPETVLHPRVLRALESRRRS